MYSTLILCPFLLLKLNKKYIVFESVRSNTYQAKQAAPIVEEVFARFKEMYPYFKTSKIDQPDPVSDDYIVQRVKGIVAHECVHIQQQPHADSNAIQCPLLYQSIREISCDLITELITGKL